MAGTFRILVVEDERDILDIVQRHLRANGFLPNGFTNPLAALAEFESDPTRYSLVLTDVRMPGMNGIELAQEILKINPKTKIVIMTAFEVIEDELRIMLPVIKHEDIIKKPFKLVEICTRIKHYVEAA